MLLEECRTSRRSLLHIFVEWVTLGLDLILLAAVRGIGVGRNMLTWLVQHAACPRSGYEMINTDGGPVVLIVNNSRVVRVESLRSLLEGPSLRMHNVFNMSEGKWNTADYYDITENGHEIITEQPISENKWMHCKQDDFSFHTDLESICSFDDTIRENHMVPPVDASILMSACEDEPLLPDSGAQWFLLNCIAMVALFELGMINFRNIQDPEITTDAHGMSSINMMNCETDFTSKEHCVSSSGAGFDLKNQSDLKNRIHCDTWLSNSHRIMKDDTGRCNLPQNSDTHCLETENRHRSATIAPWSDDTEMICTVTSEVIKNLSDTYSKVNKDDKLKGSNTRADATGEASGMQAGDKTESDMSLDKREEGSIRHAGDENGGSDVCIDKTKGPGFVRRRECSDNQSCLTQDDCEMQVDGKPDRSDMKVEGKPGHSDMQVEGKPGHSNINSCGYSEKKPKRQRNRTPTSVNRYRYRRKRCFVTPGKHPQPQRFGESRNILRSTSRDTVNFRVLSGTVSLPQAALSSQNFETNRQTEGALFRGQGHHRSAGDPKACSDFVDGLFYKAGDNIETTKLKEKLKFLLRPDGQLSELKTVKGLAMHCLPKMERWEIERLMANERRGHPHETCVDHVIQEMNAQGLKVGHVLQYFSQHHSRRDDIVRVIKEIHGDCAFCTSIYGDDGSD